jgi:hypothetical protein
MRAVSGFRGTEMAVPARTVKIPSRNAALAGAGMTSTCRATGVGGEDKQPLKNETAAVHTSVHRCNGKWEVRRLALRTSCTEIPLNKRA